MELKNGEELSVENELYTCNSDGNEQIHNILNCIDWNGLTDKEVSEYLWKEVESLSAQMTVDEGFTGIKETKQVKEHSVAGNVLGSPYGEEVVNPNLSLHSTIPLNPCWNSVRDNTKKPTYKQNTFNFKPQFGPPRSMPFPPYTNSFSHVELNNWNSPHKWINSSACSPIQVPDVSSSEAMAQHVSTPVPACHKATFIHSSQVNHHHMDSRNEPFYISEFSSSYKHTTSTVTTKPESYLRPQNHWVTSDSLSPLSASTTVPSSTSPATATLPSPSLSTMPKFLSLISSSTNKNQTTWKNNIALSTTTHPVSRTTEVVNSSSGIDCQDQNLKDLLDSIAPLRTVGEPRRPKNGFIRYSMACRQEVACERPGLENREISRILGSKWRKMTLEERKPYEEEFVKDISSIREQNPEWRYAPSKRLAAELVEPMPSRLRPRDALKRNIPLLVRPYRRKQPRQPKQQKDKTDNSSSTATMVKCSSCLKWRRLPSNSKISDISSNWLCEMNPDVAYNACWIDETILM